MLEIKKTNDGSSTLYNTCLKEHYHSTFGAYTESMHVFIKNGFQFFTKNQINVLEIGFGTGLNAILTLEASISMNILVNYTALELFPLDLKIVSDLNYSEFLNPSLKDSFLKIHESDWNQKVMIQKGFYLQKIKTDLNEYQFTNFYDLVYFDAFGPDTQPEMWSTENFKKIFDSLNPNGILVTYSSKGFVKQNLRESGFKIKRLPGPPGKRHMLRAEKNE